MKKIFCLLLILPSVVLAQIPQAPLSFQSPNAATLGMFGDVPVSYFTGLPQIETPLYTFADNKTTIPISLSYHASGFRPDMHPGWTGLGWNLSTTFAITRSINDLPDDYSNSNYYLGATMGYYFNLNSLNNSNWNQISYMQSLARTDSMLEDTEPDEYSFGYPGGSGKFYLHHTGVWKVKCDKPVKVEFNGTFLDMPIEAPLYTRQDLYGNTKSFSGFTITDERGIKYVFGMDTTAIEYGMGMFTQWLDEWIAQSWYLTKIIQPGGQEVNLTYERDNFINQMYLSVNNNIQTRVSSGGGPFNLSPTCSSSSFYNISASYGGRLISPVYLKWIIGSNAKVEFVRSNSTELGYSNSVYNFQLDQFRNQSIDAPFFPQLDQTPYSDLEGLDILHFKKLDTIKILSIDETVLRRFALDYNNTSGARLMLESITEIGKNGETKPPYEFFYDTSVSLPGYLANKNDHWGFYNGHAATIDESGYYNYYYAKRNPNDTFLYAGTLNKIIYPTGGATEFTYEPHTYRKRLQERRSLGLDGSYDQNTLAGGLRIKKITSYNLSSDAIKQIKEYIYDSAGISKGILGGYIKYYFDDYRCVAFSDGNAVYSNALFSSQSVLPGCNNAQGSHVGYSYVKEKLADNSYTEYRFTNFDNGQIDESADTTLQPSRTAYEPYASLESERGNLLSIKKFSANNTLLSKKVFAYTALNKSNEFVRALKCRYFNVCPNAAVAGEEGTAYKIYTYSYLPSSEIDTTYDINGSNYMVNTTAYTYNTSYRLVTTITSSNSKNHTVIDSLKYPFDYLSDAIYIGMTSKNIVSPVVESKKVDANSTILVSKTNYSNPYAGIYLPETGEVKNLGSAQEIRYRYYKYDAKCNLLSSSKENGIKSTFVWDYYDNYPIAECINADTASVAYTSFESNGTGGWSGVNPSYVQLSGGMTGNNYYNQTSFSLSKSALNSSNYYIVTYWSKNGSYSITGTQTGYPKTLRSITVGSVTWTLYEHLVTGQSTISISGTGAIDELRLYPKGALMTTYTYTPLIGITTKSAADNRINYFDYDGFGRLLHVRDESQNILKKHEYKYAGQ